jgi:Ca2+/H+ antiporter
MELDTIEGMGVPALLLIIFILAIDVAIIIACVKKSNEKGYETYVGLLLGIFLGLIGLIIVLCLPDKKAEQEQQKADNPAQLLRYKQLLDQGVISQEEFDIKKMELM